MRIQHNITAMNSYRNYTNNNSRLGKNLEKLSSGYAINRAGDDAAGLAISEKMRAQVTGIEVASKNAKDGISVVQTAEGALTEVHDMLNRMFALAEQANNGIYKKEEREKLQAEINQLITEVDRIGDSTNFNGMKLLDGTLSEAVSPDATITQGTSPTNVSGSGFQWSTASTAAVKAKFNEDLTTSGKNVTVSTYYYAGKASVAGRASVASQAERWTKDGQSTTTDPNDSSWTHYSSVAYQPAQASEGPINEKFELKIDISSLGSNYTIKSVTVQGQDLQNNAPYGIISNASGTAGKVGFVKLTGTTASGAAINVMVQDANGVEVGTLSFDSGAIAVDPTATTATAAVKSATIKLKDLTDPEAATAMGALTLQIGDSTNAYDKMGISVDSMKAKALNIQGLDIQTNPTDAMGRIKLAIEAVSVQRGQLGAYQNRLEHTINNLSVMRENIQDAEATIRDTDMAEEMMKYTKNNILVQSAQAMLAQANQLPQGVLSLLQ